MTRLINDSLARRVSLVALLSALITLGLGAGHLSAQEGDDGETPEESDSSGGWRPHSGSLFGGSQPAQQQTGGDDLFGGTRPGADDEAEDGRIELLVFGLEYADAVSFRDTYVERFDTTFLEALEASPSFRALIGLDRQRRMSQAAQMVVEPDEDRVEEVAVAIESPYYLLAEVGVADSRNYLISFTIGRAGEGEQGRQVFERTTNRNIDNVNAAIEELAAQALAIPTN